MEVSANSSANSSYFSIQYSVIWIRSCSNFLLLYQSTLYVHALAENLIRKFQQILATAIESFSRKGSFQQLVNVLRKITLPHFFFYIATLISLTSPWKYFFFLSGFLSYPFTNQRRAKEEGGIYLTPHYHFHPLHRDLNISREITSWAHPWT